MKNINTLIKDIYAVTSDKENWLNDEITKQFTTELGLKLQESFAERESPTLRLSQMGPKCPRHLWHSIHTPALAEPLPPWVRVKFTYGHILEALVISMAKAAGHEVTGEQDELIVDGVKGHRDCVIDGCIVDVKSAASRSFAKFKDKTLAENDSFGYLDQLDGYLVGSADDNLVRVKDKGYLLAVDKTLGHMCLYEHRCRPEAIRTRIKDYKQIVELSSPPSCTCETVPDGKSGNIKLGTVASYSPFKHCCFPGLRTFLYASGPVHLTKVVKVPTYAGRPLVEVNKFGNIVY